MVIFHHFAAGCIFLIPLLSVSTMVLCIHNTLEVQPMFNSYFNIAALHRLIHCALTSITRDVASPVLLLLLFTNED